MYDICTFKAAHKLAKFNGRLNLNNVRPISTKDINTYGLTNHVCREAKELSVTRTSNPFKSFLIQTENFKNNHPKRVLLDQQRRTNLGEQTLFVGTMQTSRFKDEYAFFIHRHSRTRSCNRNDNDDVDDDDNEGYSVFLKLHNRQQQTKKSGQQQQQQRRVLHNLRLNRRSVPIGPTSR